MFKIKLINPALAKKLIILSHSSTQIAANTITNNIFYNIDRAIFYQDGGGSGSTISNNTIINAGEYGGIAHTDGTITNNTIISSENAIVVGNMSMGGGSNVNPVINNNNLYDFFPYILIYIFHDLHR